MKIKPKKSTNNCSVKTPFSAVNEINSKNNFFTVPETKLLDQITLEIQEACKNDLKQIRALHTEAKELLKTCDGAVKILLQEQFECKRFVDHFRAKQRKKELFFKKLKRIICLKLN